MKYLSINVCYLYFKVEGPAGYTTKSSNNPFNSSFKAEQQKLFMRILNFLPIYSWETNFWSYQGIRRICFARYWIFVPIRKKNLLLMYDD